MAVTKEQAKKEMEKSQAVPDKVERAYTSASDDQNQAERVAEDLSTKSIRIVGLRTGASTVGVNPKDRIGATKVDMTLCPSSASVQWALAQMDGATKYGPYNWRIEPIQMRTYIAAMKRHIDAYLDGEQCAPDSGIHHLGHVMSCCAILIDAELLGQTVDDRPVTGNFADALGVANNLIAQKPDGWGH